MICCFQTCLTLTPYYIWGTFAPCDCLWLDHVGHMWWNHKLLLKYHELADNEWFTSLHQQKSWVQLPKTETISSFAEVLLVRFFWWGQSSNRTGEVRSKNRRTSPNKKSEICQVNLVNSSKITQFWTHLSLSQAKVHCSSFRGSFFRRKQQLWTHKEKNGPSFCLVKTSPKRTRRWLLKDVKVPGYVPLDIYDP